MTHSTSMTAAQLKEEIAKAEKFAIEGLTEEEQEFMAQQMKKHKKLLKQKIAEESA